MDQSDTSQPTFASQTTILVDFPPRAGVKAVTSKPEALAARSVAAIDAAMDCIRDMADRVDRAVGGLVKPPSDVEVEFGVKLDAEAGALIARTGVEAHLTVTLKWSSDEVDKNEDGQHPPSTA
jgi:hypothetical protein